MAGADASVLRAALDAFVAGAGVAQLELEHLRLVLLQRPSCCWWTACPAL
jgi:hypothetical protein